MIFNCKKTSSVFKKKSPNYFVFLFFNFQDSPGPVVCIIMYRNTFFVEVEGVESKEICAWIYEFLASDASSKSPFFTKKFPKVWLFCEKRGEKHE